MTNLEKAKLLGEKWAESMFEDFRKHPEYKGSTFTWDKFPSIAAGLAEASCFLHFPYNVKHLNDLKKACKNACNRRARKLIREYDLYN